MKDLLQMASLAPPPSSPAGRPPRSGVRAVHRIAYRSERKYCVFCKSKRSYKLTDKIYMFLCFTHERNCFADLHSPSCDGIQDKY